MAVLAPAAVVLARAAASALAARQGGARWRRFLGRRRPRQLQWRDANRGNFTAPM